MKKTIPFKKDIIFPSDIAEITSISLEHNIKPCEDNMFKGDFIVSGEYKVTETSSSVKDFEYKLPCVIDIDEIYDIKKGVLDIDDFYYEILNSKVLSVHIEVSVDKIEERLIEEVRTSNDILYDVSNDTAFKDVTAEQINVDKTSEIIEDATKEAINQERCIEEEEIEMVENKDNVINLFDNFNDESEVYSTYRICIVRDGESIENIMDKYNVSRDDLILYNDISEIKIGDKLIIPNAKN